MITIQTSHKTLESFFLGLSSPMCYEIWCKVDLDAGDKMQVMSQVLAGAQFTQDFAPKRSEGDLEPPTLYQTGLTLRMTVADEPLRSGWLWNATELE